MPSNSEMCICPYNKAHVLLRVRLPHHLVKCKLQHPNIQLINCPYNATHLHKQELMEEHLKECPDKILIEPWRYNLNGNQQHGDLIPTPFNEDIQNDPDNDGWN